jgi:acetyl esterase/lipase
MTTPILLDGGVQLLRDVPYGEAPVGHGTPDARLRPLLLDIYLPPGDTAPATPRPAVLLSHGGAYHRGSKETDEFEQDGQQNTPMPAYCRHLAARGYVACSIGYRLTQERCGPPPQPILQHRGGVPRGRIDYVRQVLGLPPATDDELRDGVEAVILDVAQACRFVHGQAARWSVDPARIAVGGFSAGAFASVYAAYALGVPAAAVVSLSGGIDARDAAHYRHDAAVRPPALLFSSERDLPGIHDRTMALADHAAAIGLPLRRFHVPDRPHFYDRDSAALLGSDSLGGAPAATTVGAAIDAFLDHCLQPTA